MRTISILAALILCSPFLLADEHNVDFDHHTDFSKLKTFAVRQGKVNSPRPELNNPLLLKKVADTIQTMLVARGLKDDDGKSPAAFEGRTKGFVEAVRETIDLANSIATRNSESSGARATSRELAAKLLELINP